LVAVPLVPLSVGVAVLRRRLDGAEFAVRRSLVYGWLLAAGLAVYAGVVLVLDAVLRGHAAPVVTLLAAAAVAVIFQPLRLRLQRAADRMLFGDRGDPYAVLAGLGRRLQAAGSAEQTLPETVETIAAAAVCRGGTSRGPADAADRRPRHVAGPRAAGPLAHPPR
jgi:hypothetical protein